jgi:hypothetical protein
MTRDGSVTSARCRVRNDFEHVSTWSYARQHFDTNDWARIALRVPDRPDGLSCSFFDNVIFKLSPSRNAAVTEDPPTTYYCSNLSITSFQSPFEDCLEIPRAFEFGSHIGEMCDYTQVQYTCSHLRYVVRAWCTRHQETHKRRPANVTAVHVAMLLRRLHVVN